MKHSHLLAFLTTMTLAAAGSADRLAGQESGKQWSDFVAFLQYFEPERAASLGLTSFDGRVDDLGEEGLAGRTRGYADLRAGLSGSPLFPGIPTELAPLVSSRGLLSRRVHAFEAARAWTRSPLFYVQAVSRALAEVELNPAISATERREAMTARARQLPYSLGVAPPALVNPPRVLTLEALRQGRDLMAWIETVSRRYAALPETSGKWELEQTLSGAMKALDAFLEGLDRDLLPRSNGSPGIGPDAIDELAVVLGFDGVIHGTEVLAEATRRARLEATRGSGVLHGGAPGIDVEDRLTVDAAEAFGTELAALWPSPNREVSLVVDFGPPLPGYPVPVAVVLPGPRRSEEGQIQVYIAREGPVSRGEVAELALVEGSAYTALAGAVGSGSDTTSDARLLLAWDGVALAARWFCLVAGPEAVPALSGVATSGGYAARTAFTEARAAHLSVDVHRGLRTADDVVEILAAETGMSPTSARRLVATYLSDPTRAFSPALGLRLLEAWEGGGRLPADEFLARILEG